MELITQNIKSLNHLYRHAFNNVLTTIMTDNSGTPRMCKVTSFKTQDGKHKVLFVTSKKYMDGYGIYNRISPKAINNITSQLEDSHNEIINTLLSNGEGYLLKNSVENMLDSGISSIVIVNDNIDELFDSFKKQNKSACSVLFDAMDAPMPLSYLLNVGIVFFIISNASPHLVQWGLKQLICGTPIFILNDIIKWAAQNRALSGKVSKGTITAYSGVSNVIKLQAEITKINREKRASVAVNIFNTTQKKMLRELKKDASIEALLGRFCILSEAKKRNFVRKMSTITDTHEIIRQMGLLTKSQFTWNKESILWYINNTDINCTVVVNKGNILVVEVKDYEAVKYLGKTTNWCISKNKRYWNNYMGRANNTRQYVLFNFDKPEDDELSIVGFTTAKDFGIAHAHSFTNNNLMSESKRGNIKSFCQDSRNINNILSKLNVPMELVCEYSKSKYQWCREGFLECLNYCANDNEYSILQDNENKLAVEVKFDKMHYGDMMQFLIGKQYKRCIAESFGSGSGCNYKHIIFCDFNRQETDPERLIFSIIMTDADTNMENGKLTFNCLCKQSNYTFDQVLTQFNLPYNIIKRTNCESQILKTALADNNFATFKNVYKTKKGEAAFNNHAGIKATYLNNFYCITRQSHSFDMLDMTNELGINIFNCGEDSVTLCEHIISEFLYEIVNYRGRDLKNIIISQDNIEKVLHEDEYLNRRDAHIIGNFIVIKEVCAMAASNYITFGANHMELGYKLCTISKYNAELAKALINVIFPVLKSGTVFVDIQSLAEILINVNDNNIISLLTFSENQLEMLVGVLERMTNSSKANAKSIYETISFIKSFNASMAIAK